MLPNLEGVKNPWIIFLSLFFPLCPTPGTLCATLLVNRDKVGTEGALLPQHPAMANICERGSAAQPCPAHTPRVPPWLLASARPPSSFKIQPASQLLFWGLSVFPSPSMCCYFFSSNDQHYPTQFFLEYPLLALIMQLLLPEIICCVSCIIFFSPNKNSRFYFKQILLHL